MLITWRKNYRICYEIGAEATLTWNKCVIKVTYLLILMPDFPTCVFLQLFYSNICHFIRLDSISPPIYNTNNNNNNNNDNNNRAESDRKRKGKNF